MNILAFSLFALLASCSAQKDAYDCQPGDVWADGKIKIECTAEGTRPAACLPGGKLGGKELKAGESFTDGAIKFTCVSDGELSMSYDAVACVLPNGNELAPGKQEGISNKGLFKCLKNRDGTVTRKDEYGCFFNGKLYDPGQVWTSGNGQLVCVGGNGSYEAQASGCFLPNGELIKIDSYGEQNTDKVKCLADSKEKYVAVLVKVSEKEYLQWLAGVKSGKEVSGGGGKAVGLKKTTTTTTTTTTTPTTTTTTTTPTTTTTTTTPTTTTTTTKKTTTTKRTTTKRTTTKPKCVDLHPICPDLCKQCQDSEPVGLSVRRKRIAVKPKKCNIIEPSKNLINSICPKSCGICGRDNLKKAAEKWVEVSCGSRNEEAVGLSV